MCPAASGVDRLKILRKEKCVLEREHPTVNNTFEFSHFATYGSMAMLNSLYSTAPSCKLTFYENKVEILNSSMVSGSLVLQKLPTEKVI